MNAIFRRVGVLGIAILSAVSAVADSGYPYEAMPAVPKDEGRNYPGARLWPEIVLTLGGQTPAPGGIDFTNLPQAGSVTNSTMDVSIGVVGATGINGTSSSVENLVEFRYHFGSFFLGAEIENGPASTIVDVAGIHAGVAKRWDTAEIYFFGGVRRNFSSTNPNGLVQASWEIEAGAGLAYRLLANAGISFLQPAAVFSESAFIYRIHGNSRAENQFRAGVRYFF